MKEKIHPTWFAASKIVCACGHTYETGSTIKSVSIDSCGACHPFFTGQGAKFVDAAGRVEKFNQRVAMAEKKQAEALLRQKSKEVAAAADAG